MRLPAAGLLLATLLGVACERGGSSGSWVPVMELTGGAELGLAIDPPGRPRPLRAWHELEPGVMAGRPLSVYLPGFGPAGIRWPAEAGGGLRVAVQVRPGARLQALPHAASTAGLWTATLPAAGHPFRLLLTPAPDAAVDPSRVELSVPERPAPPRLSRDVLPPPGMNVIIYVFDTLRRDRMSVYGYERATTPRLEKLAEHALVFSAAYALSSHTTASISGLFASRLPSQAAPGLADPARIPTTLAESFRKAGYRTGAFQANFLLLGRAGYDRGFETYRVLSRREGERLEAVDAAELHREALRWLKGGDGRPVFLYLQSMDAHAPYDAPAPFAEMFLNQAGPTPVAESGAIAPEDRERLLAFWSAFDPDRYDGAVRYADYEFGRFLDEVARVLDLDRTLVVVTSDHGEPLWDRGEFMHGRSLFEELVRVPLLIAHPAMTGRREIREIVAHLDLAPTLADAALGAVPASFRGASWLRPDVRLVAGPFACGELFHLKTGQVTQRFYREGPWKLIEAEGETMLYDLVNDPREERNLLEAHPFRARYLEGQLLRHLAPGGEIDGRETAPGGFEPDAEFERRLRDLGYLE